VLEQPARGTTSEKKKTVSGKKSKRIIELLQTLIIATTKNDWRDSNAVGKRKQLNGAFFGQICFSVKCVCCIWICCNANEKWSSFVDDLKEREMGL